MDTGHDTPRSSENPARMPAIAQEIFELVGKSDIQADASAIQLADELIKSPPADLQEDERPLLGHALLKNFPKALSEDQSKALGAMVEEAKQDPMSLTAQTMKRMSVLRQAVGNYFRAQVAPSDFVEVSKVENPVGMGILLLEAYRISSQVNQTSKQRNRPGHLATGYVNPRSGEIGVWMSTKGLPFNPSVLRK